MMCNREASLLKLRAKLAVGVSSLNVAETAACATHWLLLMLQPSQGTWSTAPLGLPCNYIGRCGGIVASCSTAVTMLQVAGSDLTHKSNAPHPTVTPLTIASEATVFAQ